MTALVFLGSCQKGQVQKADERPLGKVVISYQVPETGGELPVAFDLYRCSTSTGPFVLVNEKPVVPEKINRGELCELFTDESVFLGEEYYYYLVSIDREGKGRKITSTTKVLVTIPLEKSKKQRGNKTEDLQTESR